MPFADLQETAGHKISDEIMVPHGLCIFEKGVRRESVSRAFGVVCC